MHSFEDATKYLEALDQFATAFTFQTLGDVDSADKSLCHMYHGSLEEHWETLVALNKRGAGIYVTVNETDLKGRKAKNIKSVRAFYLDDDGGVTEPPIKPHNRVATSPDKQHLYYLIESKEWENHE